MKKKKDYLNRRSQNGSTTMYIQCNTCTNNVYTTVNT